jgi:hypothetical protein
MPPGTYELLIERLWYEPVTVQQVPVRAGRTSTVSVTLQPAELPVDEVSASVFREGTQGLSQPGQGRPAATWWFSDLERLRIPDQRRELSALGRYASVSDTSLVTEGLPGWLVGVAGDGVLVPSARSPDLATTAFRSAAFPLSGFAHSDLQTNGVDVEWSDVPGATLSFAARFPALRCPALR